MSDESKPGFLDGVMRGLGQSDKEADSPQVQAVKEFIASKDLTNQERGDVAGWLMGEMARTTISDMLGERPPD